MLCSNALQKPAILIHIARFTCKNMNSLIDFSNTSSAFKDTIENYALKDIEFVNKIKHDSQKIYEAFMALIYEGEIFKPFLRNLELDFFYPEDQVDIYKIDHILSNNPSLIRKKIIRFFLWDSKIDQSYISAMHSYFSDHIDLTNMNEEIFHMVRKHRKRINSAQIENTDLILKHYPEINLLSVKHNHDFSGFKNLKTLHINCKTIDLCNLPNLGNLFITDAIEIRNIDIPSLVSLVVSNSAFDYDLNNFTKLRNLEFKKIDQLNCSLFKEIKLNSLKIRNSKISGFDLINFYSLKFLVIDEINIDDGTFEKIKTAQLKSISIQRCDNLTNLLHINPSNLQKVIIQNCKKIKNIHQFIVMTSKKTFFRLDNMGLNKIYLNFIYNFRKGTPRFFKHQLDNQTLSQLIDLGMVFSGERISLEYQKLTSIESLHQFQNIETLFLSGNPLTNGNEFIRMKNLTHLYISETDITNFDFIHEMNLFVLDVSHTSFGIDDLEKSKIDYMVVGGSSCTDIEHRQRLNNYLVSNQNSFVGFACYESQNYFHIVEQIERLERCPPIKIDSNFKYYLEFKCEFESLTITDKKYFKYLAEVPNLKELKIECEFTEEDFAYVRNLRKLESLTIVKNSLGIENFLIFEDLVNLIIGKRGSLEENSFGYEIFKEFKSLKYFGYSMCHKSSEKNFGDYLRKIGIEYFGGL